MSQYYSHICGKNDEYIPIGIHQKAGLQFKRSEILQNIIKVNNSGF